MRPDTMKDTTMHHTTVPLEGVTLEGWAGTLAGAVVEIYYRDSDALKERVSTRISVG